MKKIVFGLILVLLACCVKAQDVIVKKDNATILSKVTKISSTEIEYKKWSNLDGPTYTINKSEVSSVNYENGERDIFDKPKDDLSGKPYMKRVGKNLSLDHVLLTAEEVRNLFGEENYQTYIGARQQMDAGTFFGVVFVGSLCWDLVCAVTIFTNANPNNVDLWLERLLIGALITDVSCPLMCVFSGIGKGRLNWLANEYNKQHQGYSLNLTPSIIRCKTPQSQNHYALGMTLRYSF